MIPTPRDVGKKVSEFFGQQRMTEEEARERPKEFYQQFFPKQGRISIIGPAQGPVLMIFDALLEETHTLQNTLTENPVEGSTVVDHIIVRPDEVSFRAVVSNHPLLVEASTNAKPIVDGTDPAARADEAWRWLKEVRNKKYLCDLTLYGDDYTNMAITSLVRTIDKSTGQIMDVKITMRELPIAQTQVTQAPTPKKPEQKVKQQKGKKTKQPADATTDNEKKSVLSKIFGGFGGL